MSNAGLAIALRIGSGLGFVTMSAIIRLLADSVALGQLVFYRSFFAMIPLVIFMLWRRELPRGLMTTRIGDHVLRSIFGCCGMFATMLTLRFLPLADAQALSFASPIFLVMLAAVMLGEVIRPIRWLGVGMGLAGVLIMVWPQLGHQVGGTERFLGSILALFGAMMGALAGLQIRRLARSESPGAIAFYFALFCTIVSLATLPFGWASLSMHDRLLLVGMGLVGGVAQILMTLAFSRVEASVLAPFDYLTMVWALAYGVLLFAEWPELWTLAGAAVVLASTAVVAHVESRRKPIQTPKGG